MRYDKEMLRRIFAKTDGRCHVCWSSLAYSNYGAHGNRGAWEVDHATPLAEGGTDRLNNLYPACTSCNRSKQASSSRSARRAYGKTRAPMSAEAIERAKLKGAITGALAAALFGARFAGPPGFWIGLVVGGIAGYAGDPEAA